MRGVVFSRRGEPAEVAEAADLPTASEPGPDEVRVSIGVAPIHRGDLVGIEAAPDATFGARPLGTEAMGVVSAVGGSVSTVHVGSRVSVFPAIGAWSEEITVPSEAAVPMPDSVNDEIAAVTLVNGITSCEVLRAIDAVRTAAGADGGTPLIVSAAASAVGKLIVRQALDRGIRVIALVRGEKSAETVTTHFPDAPVVVTGHDGWQGRLRELTGPRGVPAIADAHGGEFVREMLAFLSDSGTLVVWGDLSAHQWTLSTLDLLMRELRVQAVSISRWMTRSDDVRAEDRRAAAQLAQQWPELFAVYAAYPLGQLRSAIEAVRTNGTGTVLLRLR